MKTLTLLMSGLLLGLGVGWSCVAFCAPVLIPHIAADHRGTRNGVLTSFLFGMGRLVAYLIYAIAVGLLGRTLAEYQYGWASPIMFILSIVLMIYGFSISFGHIVWPRLTAKICGEFTSNNSTFTLGLLAGLSPCIPLGIAIAYSLTLGSILLSIVFFVSFWMGTSVYTWVLGGITGALGDYAATHMRVARIRRVCGIALIVVGLLFLSESARFLIF